MTIPVPPPDPREPAILSERERSVLARIESDLADADPSLAREFATRRAPVLGMRPPVSAAQLGLLMLILAVLAGAGAALPVSVWWPVLPVLTLGLVPPWIALCLRRSADR